jgi:hypothetical protein
MSSWFLVVAAKTIFSIPLELVLILFSTLDPVLCNFFLRVKFGKNKNEVLYK